MPQLLPPPPVLTIAGSDSSAGAGVQADLKAISALGGYGLNALTSVVAESPGRVSLVHLLEPEMVADQIRVLFEAYPIAALKTGMLGGLPQVQATLEALERYAPAGLPLVVDPVMVATGGGQLLMDEAVLTVRNQLLPRAIVATPNMDEAGVLWGRPVKTREDMEACASELSAELGTAILLKGGHLQGAAADLLCIGTEKTWFESERTLGVHTHGTGCTYSAAIATGLARGLSLVEAVAQAKRYISAAITDFFCWQGGHGDVHALNHLTNSALK